MVEKSLSHGKRLCANVVFEKLVAYLGSAPENLGIFKESIIDLKFERQYFAKAGVFNGFLHDTFPLPAQSHSGHKQGYVTELIRLGYRLVQNFLNNELIYPVLAFRSIHSPHCLQSQN